MGAEEGGVKGEVGQQEGGWDPEERLGKIRAVQSSEVQISDTPILLLFGLRSR